MVALDDKSPAPGAPRDRSTTPLRGRSQTPSTSVTGYMSRRSQTPSGVPSAYRSITPFLKRGEKEKTPFELGTDLKAQLICNKMVFDKALVMDITEDEDPPARYITSDVSVIDRAAVMDVSNVEVIYMIEEYEDIEPEEVIEEEIVPVKKVKKRAPPRKQKAAVDEVSESPARDESVGVDDDDFGGIHERSPSIEKKKAVKKKAPKKEKKEKSPSPKLRMEEKKPPAKAPPGKSKLALQMEEQAKKAKAEAERQAAIEAERKRKAEEAARLKAEEEERRRQEEEEAMLAEEEQEIEDFDNFENLEEQEIEPEPVEEPYEEEEREPSTKASSVESFVRPDPEEEKRWQRIADEEGEDFAAKIRSFNYALRQKYSEKERDDEWQQWREKQRNPRFINFLTDRAVPEGAEVRLVCAATGPELSVKWYKDGKICEPGKGYRILNNNGILSLTKLNTTILDSGEYKCLIYNSRDEATSTCYITVYQIYKDEPSLPMFSLVKDYFHLHDDELTIECHCHGIPRPIVTWKKGGLPVVPNYKFTILEEAHGVYKLLIYRPSDRDSGLYTITANNNVGEAVLVHNVEFVKSRHWHGKGVHLARDYISKAVQAEAAQAMDEAMKSKKESDLRYVSAYSRPGDESQVSTKQKLRIATHLRDRIALIGSDVKLSCNIIGPDARILWQKDDENVVYGDKVRNLSSEGKAVLHLTDLNASASGVYKCIAKNDHNEVNTTCYLKVHSAQAEGDESQPMFALPIKDVYHSLQNDLIISTKVRGNPTPKISWLKDKIPVQLDARIQQIEQKDGICELIINKPIKTEDAGVYTCIAKNSLGEAEATHTVAVDNLPASRRSSLNISMDLQEQGTRSSRSRSRLGSVVGERGRKKSEPSGEYERRHVAVPEPSIKEKLYFIANMHNRYVPEGKKCKLQACFGGPDPQIKWFKNGEPVVYGPKTKNTSAMTPGMATLEFTEPTEEDSGEYTLIIKNQTNEIETSAKLQVFVPQVSSNSEPVFTRTLKDIYHLHSHELVLETHCRGEPLPEITWFKDNLKIDTKSPRIEINNHPDGTCELIIDKPNKNDSGKYSVEAENKLGKSMVSHYIIFENEEAVVTDQIHGVFHADKNLLKKNQQDEPYSYKREEKKEKEEAKEETPSAPETKKKREKKVGIHFQNKLMNRVVPEGSKLKLSCFVQGQDPVVKWFLNDEPIAYSPKTKIQFNQGLCTLEIPSASEENSGTYKVVGKDERGEATTSCQVEVYPDPGSGDVAPTFTRGIKDTYIPKANELVLSCHARGVPTPSITWYKDAVLIEANERYQMSEKEDGTCELYIMGPVVADSGKYTCKAENIIEEVEVSHQVIVEARMVRPLSPTRSYVESSREGTKEPGSKAPSVAKEADPASRRESVVEKRKKVEEEISYGGRRSPPPPPDPKKNLYFGNTIPNRSVPVGSKIRLSVSIFGPEPAVKWYRKGAGPEGEDVSIPFTPRTKMTLVENLAVLVLDKVEEDDSGLYKVVAKGSQNAIEQEFKILVFPTVRKELDPVAPTFTVGIKDNYSLNNDELVLECRVRGNPTPKIKWSHGGLPIVPDDVKFIQLDEADGLCKLIVKNPTKKSSGLYCCEASNNVQTEKMCHEVIFGGMDSYIHEKTVGFYHRDPNKPRLLQPLGAQTIAIGGTMSIVAEFADSLGTINCEWSLDKKPIIPDENIYTFEEGNARILTIRQCTFDHEGTYTCFAKNSYGKLEANGAVVINQEVGKSKQAEFLSRPDTTMKIKVGDPFSISFRVQGDPKPKLTLFKGAVDITKSERVTKEVSDDYTRYTIHDSTEKDSGTYFVVARNDHNSDRIFVTVTVKHPDKKPNQ